MHLEDCFDFRPSFSVGLAEAPVNHDMEKAMKIKRSYAVIIPAHGLLKVVDDQKRELFGEGGRVDVALRDRASNYTDASVEDAVQIGRILLIRRLRSFRRHKETANRHVRKALLNQKKFVVCQVSASFPR